MTVKSRSTILTHRFASEASYYSNLTFPSWEALNFCIMEASREGDTSSEMMANFKSYAAELTARHDRQERLVRMSRDVTTESKRIIFFLHSLKKDDDEASHLESAEKRISLLAEGLLKKAAAELHETVDEASLRVPLHKVVYPALEELCEAYCLLMYMKNRFSGGITSWNDIQSILETGSGSDAPYFILDPLCHMLGMMDFTGELMRVCINKASESDNPCFIIRNLMRRIYSGFIGIEYHHELNRKMTTMRQSLLKVEEACYRLKIRKLNLCIESD